MSNRTEPTKAENDKANIELNRATRDEHFLWLPYKDARAGLARKNTSGGHGTGNHSQEGYTVRAFLDGQDVEVAYFPFDPFSSDSRRATARMMAEDLAVTLNERNVASD